MHLSRTARRVLLACVVSNTAFAAIGVGLTTQGHTTPLAAGDVTLRPPTGALREETSTSLTSVPASADTSSAQSAAPTSTRSPSSRASSSTRTPTTSPAAAANDVTGIASSAAPPTSSRTAPDAGSYPATFSGSATVNGRSQSFPPSGAIVFSGSGNNLQQSAPNTPGDVVLNQRFTSGKSSLVSFQIKAGDDTKVFKPANPVGYLLYNAPQGTTWSWSASSTDGATHIDANGQVVGQQTMHLDGEDVPVVEMTTSFTLSGDITGTAELTVWVSPTYRLPLMQRQVINAKAQSGYGLSTRLVSDVTLTLTTLRPA